MRTKPKVTKAIFRSNSNAKLLLQLRTIFRDVNNLESMDNGRPYNEEGVDGLNPARTPGSLDATVGEQQVFRLVPSLFTSPPPIIDALITDTTRKRHDTIERCLPYLSRTHKNPPRFKAQNIPKLEREKHVTFLKEALQDAKFMAYDASRPWVVYWSLCGLSLLGENVEVYMEK